MATTELEYTNIESDINAMALFAKASYCKVKPTEDNKNPHSVNTPTVCRLGGVKRNPTIKLRQAA